MLINNAAIESLTPSAEGLSSAYRQNLRRELLRRRRRHACGLCREWLPGSPGSSSTSPPTRREHPSQAHGAYAASKAAVAAFSEAVGARGRRIEAFTFTCSTQPGCRQRWGCRGSMTADHCLRDSSEEASPRYPSWCSNAWVDHAWRSTRPRCLVGSDRTHHCSGLVSAGHAPSCTMSGDPVSMCRHDHHRGREVVQSLTT